MASGRAETIAQLERAGQLVEHRIYEGGDFDGWSGKDVLCHLAAYARVAGAILQAAAEGRQPTDRELYGRELTDEERALADVDEVNEAIRREHEALTYDEALAFWRAMYAEVLAQAARLSDAQLAAPGPAHPPHWRRPHLSEVTAALVQHCEGHMAGAT